MSVTVRASRIKNPVLVLRLREDLTLAEAAKAAGVNLQAFFLQEKGTYHDLLPSIVEWLKTLVGVDVDEVRQTYTQYQADKRSWFGAMYALDQYQWDAPTDQHPFVQFRESFGLSRMAFAKNLCVHASSLYRLEHYLTNELPHQLVEALQGAGLNDAALAELRYRVRETDVTK